VKLLFDESLSPKLVDQLADLFGNRNAHFETGLRVGAVADSSQSTPFFDN
jgi:hypothetical protein